MAGVIGAAAAAEWFCPGAVGMRGAGPEAPRAVAAASASRCLAEHEYAWHANLTLSRLRCGGGKER